MATLQNIRSKGPLLVIVIGLALFAFIAGDAWKAVTPHQSQDIGEINGKAVSAQEFQQMLEEYTEIIKLTSGLSALTEEQNSQIKDEVWNQYVNNRLIEDEAKKIGLTVTKEEIQAIIDAGVHPALQRTPFANPQTGMFDKDILKKFLVDYDNMVKSGQFSNNPYLTQYKAMYDFWIFVEKSLKQSRLAEKYQSLLANSILVNPVETQNSFESRVNQMDIQLAAIPYNSIPDSTVKVLESEVKSLYNKKKEQFRQYDETRDVKYINVRINASAQDRAALDNEMLNLTEQLREQQEDYTTFIRQSGSEYPYTDLYYNKTAYPLDILSRLDSVSIGETYGPYYNPSDNTLNSFKLLAKANLPDSIEFRQMEIYREGEDTKLLADSIVDAIKKGASFSALAEQYSIDGMGGQPNWISGQNYENSNVNAENLRYLQAITGLGVNEVTHLSFGEANVILQVTARKATKEKYKAAVVKRPVEFSKETYNKAYNDFSQFIAANPSLKDITANAEESGYALLERNDLHSSEHTIGGVKGSKEAIRWAFQNKTGEISPLYECGDGDQLLVVAVAGITKEGYRPYEDVKSQLVSEVIKDKKAEQLISDLKTKNISAFSQVTTIDKVVTDSIRHITLAAPTYVSALYSSEPAVSGYASALTTNKVSAPFKGNAAVFVINVYEKETLDEAFDAVSEQATLQNRYQSSLGRFINDLYLKAKVKDSRYLYF